MNTTTNDSPEPVRRERTGPAPDSAWHQTRPLSAPELPADYRAWYSRGWRYSGRETATLDHGDAIGAPDAWYDGYLDRAAGRAKWHLANCRGCPEHPGPGAPAPELPEPAGYAVWYAATGCLPDSDGPEYVGTLAECESWVDEHAAEYERPDVSADTYALTIDSWDDDDDDSDDRAALGLGPDDSPEYVAAAAAIELPEPAILAALPEPVALSFRVGSAVVTVPGAGPVVEELPAAHLLARYVIALLPMAGPGADRSRDVLLGPIDDMGRGWAALPGLAAAAGYVRDGQSNVYRRDGLSFVGYMHRTAQAADDALIYARHDDDYSRGRVAAALAVLRAARQ